jgi:hypothetical protein
MKRPKRIQDCKTADEFLAWRSHPWRLFKTKARAVWLILRGQPVLYGARLHGFMHVAKGTHLTVLQCDFLGKEEDQASIACECSSCGELQN